MVISIINQKGGVGKTTTAFNLGVALVKLGKRVLLIDMDPQGNLTSALGAEEEKQSGTYELLSDDLDPQELLMKLEGQLPDLIPAHMDLAGFEIECLTLENREYVLDDKLQSLRFHYDYVILDCSPSLGLLTINALVASDDVIVPIQCEYFALEGLSKLLETMQVVKTNYNTRLSVLGLLLTMYDARLALSNQVYEELKAHFDEMLFQTIIPRNVKVAESVSFGLSVMDYDQSSKGAMAYSELANEVILKSTPA